MSVTGHWRRSALGASGVALLLPLALAVGVGLTAALGGQTSLRALGQVFAGPAVPHGLSAPELGEARAVPSVPPRRPEPAAMVAGPSSPPSPVGPAPAGPGPTAPQPSRPDPASPSELQPSESPAAPDPVAQPEPGPAPPGSVVHETGQAVTDVVAELPAPAGTAGADAMQTVVDLIP